MPAISKYGKVDMTEKELEEMSREEITHMMTDREVLFCEHYIKNYNAKLAAIKAGYKISAASMVAYKVRKKTTVVRYIAWLKLRLAKQCQLEAFDFLEKYMRIAFSDITDFVVIENNKLQLIDGEKLDGQLVKQMKQGRDGVTIELWDKFHALNKLEQYFDFMPKDWKQKVEERKLELLEKKFELDKIKAGLGEEITEDDGFLEALKDTSNSIWE